MGHLRSDLWALRKEINNLIGQHKDIFESQNRLGFPPHHHRTQAEPQEWVSPSSDATQISLTHYLNLF